MGEVDGGGDGPATGALVGLLEGELDGRTTGVSGLTGSAGGAFVGLVLELELGDGVEGTKVLVVGDPVGVDTTGTLVESTAALFDFESLLSPLRDANKAATTAPVMMATMANQNHALQ